MKVFASGYILTETRRFSGHGLRLARAQPLSAEGETVSAQQEPIRVLVVDDEERFRTNVQRLLHGKEFSIACAASGSEALSLLEKESFDVIVLDQKMPGMSGAQTLERLRQQGCQPAVLFLTGHTSREEASHAMSLGASDYQLKPLTMEQLALKIREVHKAGRNCAIEPDS